MKKKTRRGPAYVRLERETGETLFSCGACDSNLNPLLKKHKEKIILKIILGKRTAINYKCPGCGKKLDWNRLSVKSEITPVSKK